MEPIRIGARGSKLSLTQAAQMQRAIAAALGADPAQAEQVAPVVVITTTGDRVQDRRLIELGGKAMFTKEIEDALSEGRIDCAVHSMKDVPIARQPGLVLAATTEREDPRDAFLSPGFATLEALPHGARLGGASLRRQAQAQFRRPDLTYVLVRGNVDTRLAKLAAGEADAMVMAMAGLNRLGLQGRIRHALDPIEYPPAPGQGALAIETRAADADAVWARALNHGESALAVAAERGALEALEGSCRTAMGAYAEFVEGRLTLVVEALTADGRERLRRLGEIDGDSDSLDAARALGRDLGAQIREEGGDRLLIPVAGD
ncbi:MAG TPA: hydroxymethylbilane synthase [Caulobacteraceae bacterium]|jgi:hydroxymethylbilane synthase|nr:hydroxymethylbilane synthase [Caulobacteraceae bacterium]